MSYSWIRASEIGDYIYCNRSWWLKRSRGVAMRPTRELAGGIRYHRGHAGQVHQALWLRRLALTLLFLALAIGTYLVVAGG